ncbi:hypothetical protein TIFTF001_044360 [Ficus carica]|uniref:Uncharacterized protein n=1 Tax=Ficus carica TaxID=3494 RepID=A0AA87ZDC2_FICCA|nr:hypothetical protein TIFTF001_044360 [Ficus carica]
MRLLWERFKLSKFISFPSSSERQFFRLIGIGPVKLLWSAVKLTTLTPLHTWGGKWPVKLFPAKCRTTNDQEFPNPTGTTPDKLLVNTRKSDNLLKVAIFSGNGPDK